MIAIVEFDSMFELLEDCHITFGFFGVNEDKKTQEMKQKKWEKFIGNFSHEAWICLMFFIFYDKHLFLGFYW